MILRAFLFSLFSILASSLIPVLWFRPARKEGFAWIPFILGLGFFNWGLFSGVFSQLLGFGWGNYGVVFILTTWANYLLVRFIPSHISLRAGIRQPVWRLAICAVIALAMTGDIFFILDRNGWSFDPGLWGPRSSTYFRPPMHNDDQRNVVVIEALLRGDGSPFFPHASFAYQLFWHRLFASFAFPFHGLTKYSVIGGFTLTTSFLFFFTLVWTAAVLRPALMLRRSLGWAALLLGFLHADLYHFVRSLILHAKPGIEADWSMAPDFFRYFSSKLLALTSPQHAFFLLLMSVWVALDRGMRPRGTAARVLTGPAILAMGILASPVLGIFFWGSVYGARLIRCIRRRVSTRGTIVEAALAVAVPLSLCGVVTGTPVVDLLSRPRGDTQFLIRNAEQWLKLPLLWVVSIGILFAPLFLVLTNRLKMRWRAWAESPLAVFLLLGGLGLNFVVTEPELRRHYAMLAGWAAFLFIVREVCLVRARRRETAMVLAFSSGVAVALHAYFLLSYTSKPSKLDPRVAWRDYFEINQVIRDKRIRDPVLAAVEPMRIGLEMPIVMEAATSFSLSHHAAIHTKIVSEEHWELIRLIAQAGIPVPWGKALGYHLIVWGPVEERVWGERVKDRFIRENLLIARRGGVSLYWLWDRLAWEDGVGKEPTWSVSDHLSHADRLREGGWDWEALSHYLKAIQVQSGLSRAHAGAAQSLLRLGQKRAALRHLHRALAIDPSRVDLLSVLGSVYRDSRMWDDAEKTYRFWLELTPGSVEAQSAIVDLYLAKGSVSEAEAAIERVRGKGGDRVTYLCNLGKVRLAQGKFAEARELFWRADQRKISHSERISVLLGLGDAESHLGNLKAAARAFDEVLLLDDRNSAALMRLANLSLQAGDALSAASRLRRVVDREPWNQVASRSLAILESPEAK